MQTDSTLAHRVHAVSRGHPVPENVWGDTLSATLVRGSRGRWRQGLSHFPRTLILLTVTARIKWGILKRFQIHVQVLGIYHIPLICHSHEVQWKTSIKEQVCKPNWLSKIIIRIFFPLLKWSKAKNGSHKEINQLLPSNEIQWPKPYTK